MPAASVGSRRVPLAAIALLLALVGCVWLVHELTPVGRRPAPLRFLAFGTTASAALAIFGLWLRHGWAPWMALIAVSLGATIACFAASLPLSTLPLALTVGVVVGSAAMLFAVGHDQGPGLGVFPRLLFGTVFCFAGWVAYWGWLHPKLFGQVLPISAPPLHARFLAAMYLSGGTFMLLAMVSRAWSHVATVVWILVIWTGVLGLISVWNVSAFNWSRQPTWFWFVAYMAFPLMAAWVGWSRRKQTHSASGARLGAVARGLLMIIGLSAVALGITLLLSPATMSRLWPWALPVVLAQIYSAPFLAYGIGLLLTASRPSFADGFIPIAGTLIFCAGALAASVLHSPTFSRTSPASWVWFLGFGLSGVALLAIACLPAMRTGR